MSANDEACAFKYSKSLYYIASVKRSEVPYEVLLMEIARVHYREIN